MFDFNNIKSKVIDSISKAADTTKDLADKASDKAKDVSRIAKLSLEINSEKDVIRKAYSEIGKLYYEMHKDNPEGFFIQLCDEVTLAQENIAAKEAEIAELKAGSSDDDDSITVEFEEVVSDGEKVEEDSCCDPYDFEPEPEPDDKHGFGDAGENEKSSTSEGGSEHPDEE
ncbi:MAG: hypothetical protein ACOX81_02315 [Candidatus Heteroscillospira sp.]|jgi:hypothetical protein